MSQLSWATLKRQCHDNRDFWQPFLWGRWWWPQGKATENDNCSRKTTFALLSLGRKVVRAADQAVMVWSPRHLREQSPFYARAKKSKNHWISWHCPFKKNLRRRSGQSVTASDFGSNGPRFESGRGGCVESLDKALYSHCPQEKPHISFY